MSYKFNYEKDIYLVDIHIGDKLQGKLSDGFRGRISNIKNLGPGKTREITFDLQFGLAGIDIENETYNEVSVCIHGVTILENIGFIVNVDEISVEPYDKKSDDTDRLVSDFVTKELRRSLKLRIKQIDKN